MTCSDPRDRKSECAWMGQISSTRKGQQQHGLQGQEPGGQVVELVREQTSGSDPAAASRNTQHVFIKTTLRDQHLIQEKRLFLRLQSSETLKNSTDVIFFFPPLLLPFLSCPIQRPEFDRITAKDPGSRLRLLKLRSLR